MLTMQKANDVINLRVPTDGQDIETLLEKEWLLTNGRGGYASSTIAGCNTRSYHGLLVGSLQPPVNRVMALSNCLEMIQSKGKTFSLSTFEFSDKFTPKGFRYLKMFRRDIGAHFDYILPNVELTRSVYLQRQADTVAIVYDFTRIQKPVEFMIRPFVGLRNFHALQESYAPLCSDWFGSADYGLIVRQDISDSCCLHLCCPLAEFETDPQWWYNFTYRVEKERGQGFTEDLWAPGIFKCRIDSPIKIILWAHLNAYSTGNAPAVLKDADLDAICQDLHYHQDNLKQQASPMRPSNAIYFDLLCLATDQFVTQRTTQRGCSTTILAGYPWFADWGRDAFISLPGLLLSTCRFDQAKSVLTTFAAVEDKGMIPNRFDDYSDTTHFNSVDASLWFINAVFQYLAFTDDLETFTRDLLPTICRIVVSYHTGTRYGIHADRDGLISAGDEDTQLTWMDAKCDGTAFTPRYGKAVEVNALWYNALRLLAEFYSDRNEEDAGHYQSMADKVQAAFCRLFWNERKGYLNDYILPNGSANSRLRPNQIFAVSLKYSALPLEQQKAVVATVQDKLLTPYGLRTLDPLEPDYKGVYTGPMRQRDEAYHQGTVWPFLMGPFIEAYLKVHEFSHDSKQQALEFLQPLLRHLTEETCLGSISEIFDGDPPHKPKGCFAQAWSIAELIRVYQLTTMA
ncbi:MAG: glycogen debranching enzyme family protein [Sedimentisphaerales bacterium]|nr:glycogen debranching enzyme family protein [Sedimentisphaerales bacterium]